ncbi:MAG: hypothetical protein ACLVCH_10110 [Roseburia inulinivorans]
MRFKTPAFLAVILGILASVSGLMNGFMLSPAGVIWTTMKDMITAARYVTNDFTGSRL